MTMNRLPHPVRPHIRQDGREIVPLAELDFRGPDYSLLMPGLIVGMVIRYHWPEVRPMRVNGNVRRSRRVHLLGTYAGETTIMDTKTRWLPESDSTRANSEKRAPILELELWKDGFTKLAVGCAAVALVSEDRTAIIDDKEIDYAVLSKALNVSPNGDHSKPHLGRVQEGGLYYVKPLEPAVLAP